MPSLQVTRNKAKIRHSSLVTCHFKVKQGFTLIELLIVITIIGILASLTLATYGNTQQKARDGVRKSDLGQIRRALELAKSDCSSAAYYPAGFSGDQYEQFDGLQLYLADTDLNYMSGSVPDDPKNVTEGSLNYKYGYSLLSSQQTNVCADGDGDATYTEQSGSSQFTLSALMERGPSDSESYKSREKCKNKPGPDGDTTDWTGSAYAGYYVVCSS
ncbi:hypothetical protein A2615_00535 [Candidatus Curtissbacteria bacterium RIFOXYD1_FULL_41_36]|uniref:Type II secretion system protein GspG C-terminal domain-containing protein n=2 Tax=Candidatus Curtissiibacteriota TaxID=1752717 RepID=A0A1F5HF86_9BACT|nr:MAG: Tfp pilus assembly protein, major pilin PilA [Candidatus Curtissbacteria bacterium GW2011_GWB1_40_28]KKS00731.1 MAG: Tfp pilus assembly protein, major pilin PilA [Candidatus Curtissbacteria bacterium GW2011_GWC2_41_21]KKT65738.1 MAG: Tfp pilus assembly protein, major pilin PilA [Candidatus Curtissbacteria bacterium GW2011_GWC1_44_33]OGE02740.1 MAG: hypothetical protein A2196_03445 [Candidatus Curtissbacteria bacterium RIFOXYA1_FULL_41_14]OGE07318.1 MAG: hypothetical protein A2615_00535 